MHGRGVLYTATCHQADLLTLYMLQPRSAALRGSPHLTGPTSHINVLIFQIPSFLHRQPRPSTLLRQRISKQAHTTPSKLSPSSTSSQCQCKP
jgi:hypothetical protein